MDWCLGYLWGLVGWLAGRLDGGLGIDGNYLRDGYTVVVSYEGVGLIEGRRGGREREGRKGDCLIPGHIMHTHFTYKEGKVEDIFDGCDT